MQGDIFQGIYLHPDDRALMKVAACPTPGSIPVLDGGGHVVLTRAQQQGSLLQCGLGT